MRRGSVIGPLVLITIGALFLLRNFIPEIPVWQMFSRYWPVLLILWGSIRLLEILFWAATSKPLPRNGISGGEWTVLFFICIIGATAYSARRYTWFPTGRTLHGLVVNMGESFDYTMPDANNPCARPCRVVIENFRGNAKITGVADLSSVKVSGHKTVRAFQQGDADNADKQTPLELIADGNQLIVRTNQDRVSDSLRVSADLEIQVPVGASLEAHGRSGDFDVQALDGAVDITSDNAGIRLQNLGGNVRIDTRRSDVIHAVGVKGSMDLRGRGQDLDFQDIRGPVTVAGTYVGQVQLHNLEQPLRYQDPQITLNIEKLPGEVRMSLGSFSGTNLVGPIHLAARSRDVQLTDFTQALDLSLERGDVELRPGKSIPKMDIQIAKSGDIDLGLSPSSNFDLKASATRGEVLNDYGSPLSAQESGRGGTIEGNVGSGPPVRLQTTRGSITVRKATDNAPPAPPKSHEAPQPPKAPVKIEDQ